MWGLVIPNLQFILQIIYSTESFDLNLVMVKTGNNLNIYHIQQKLHN